MGVFLLVSALNKWVWLKIKREGLRRFWSMFPLTRATHFGTGFLSHTQISKMAQPPKPTPICQCHLFVSKGHLSKHIYIYMLMPPELPL